MRKTLVLWDHVSVVVIVGITLIGVQRSRQFRCQPQAQTRTSTAVPTTMHPARQNQARARVNHVAVEDAQAAPDVIIGMILVNNNGAIVLFDSGASHSFVAANFCVKT
jgi:hypothetical protein